MTSTESEGSGEPTRPRRRRTVRLRTLLIGLAAVTTVAMGAQVAVTTERLLQQSENLRADVAAGDRTGVPLYRLMVEMQAERAATAAWWAGSKVSQEELRKQRAATDRAAAVFRRSAGHGAAESERADRYVVEVRNHLDELDTHRGSADARDGSADQVIGYYTDVIDRMIRVYQQFSQMDDAELTQESRPVVALLSASELLAREDTILALSGPSKQLGAARFAEFINTVGAHRYLYDTWIVPELPAEDRKTYDRIAASDAWRAKTAIENAVITDHTDNAHGVRLPDEVGGWRAAREEIAPRLAELNTDRQRGVLAHADAKADELEAEVAWLVAGSGGALLLVVVVVVFATRSVLRRMNRLHQRTVTVAEQTLPEVVARLQRGQSVDADALPGPSGERDEVGRISDAFARVVAVSVDGHRQLAEERHGFGLFAAGIASRTGNLVSRQLTLTEDLQDTFGHDEALLAQLMRSDQLTVGMRRQIENLLILTGGEVPDPHTEPMRVADLLREAAAEVEDFRRIERHALDEVSVEPRAISQISHLLAELLDNATRFSPPRSKVVIRAEAVTDGLSVEIEDRGPRVAPERYEEMNGRLHSAPPYAVLAQNAHRLGLFVVGHLAEQLGARVTLRRSAFGGTSAVVIIPSGHLVRTEPQPSPEPPEPAPAPRPRGEGEREVVRHLRPTPVRRSPDPESPAPDSRDPASPAPESAAAPSPAPRLPALPSRTPAEDRPAPPPLPERVPQTHIARQLRAPRAEETVGQDTATPEEVADAWADYEDGTQTVEAELRQDRP
ncbi:sensor histidine kinase [Streptomyces sp. XD-27]|uniref:sensor histidine kinase n=1 Tax=Streptomyces sp. XD-27 TaxID=3062779 RepID=UPI0026F45B83|nr:sensor histidine kinase [Streptomyces sp. XD-27]WKX69075.1 sensor histidine kinase [Streptomyces sp. XD-27]